MGRFDCMYSKIMKILVLLIVTSSILAPYEVNAEVNNISQDVFEFILTDYYNGIRPETGEFSATNYWYDGMSQSEMLEATKNAKRGIIASMDKFPNKFSYFTSYEISTMTNPYDTSSLTITLSSNKMSDDLIITRHKKFLSKCKEIKRRLDKKEMKKAKSELDKLKLIHLYIVNNVEYDSKDWISHTGFGATQYGKAVCSGYVAMFIQLAEEYGIYSEACTGNPVNKPSNRHIWVRYINNEGKSYYFDPTYDDTGGTKIKSDLKFCGISKQKILKTHEFDRNQ